MGRRDGLLIGELAARFGVNRETLRYYERRGLLRSRRTPSGYRLYDDEAVERLAFIRRAQAFGFSLEEIGELLSLNPDSPRSCDRVLKMLDDKLSELARRIEAMQRFHEQLAHYRKQCRVAIEEGEACPLIWDVTHPAGADGWSKNHLTFESGPGCTVSSGLGGTPAADRERPNAMTRRAKR